MSDIRAARNAVVTRILEGDGTASRAQRRAAFDNVALAAPQSAVIQKVALQACNVADDDIAAVRSSGLSEDQIFELLVCAAVGQATRQYDAAIAALAATMERNADATRDP